VKFPNSFSAQSLNFFFFSGTFKVYNPTVDITELSTYGFSGGTFDNRTWYVGYGDNSPCSGQIACPGLLTDDPTKPGAYFSCVTTNYQRDNNYYLLDHPNLEWVLTNSTDMMTLTGAIPIMNAAYRNFFGRYVVNGVSHQCKVFTANYQPYLGCYYIKTLTSYGLLHTDFEVLTCGKNWSNLHYRILRKIQISIL
jgi:hypothetical protein